MVSFLCNENTCIRTTQTIYEYQNVSAEEIFKMQMLVVYFTTKTSFLVCSQTVLFFFFFFERFFKERGPDIFVDKSMTKSIFWET